MPTRMSTAGFVDEWDSLTAPEDSSALTIAARGDDADRHAPDQERDQQA